MILLARDKGGGVTVEKDNPAHATLEPPFLTPKHFEFWHLKQSLADIKFSLSKYLPLSNFKPSERFKLSLDDFMI